MNLSGRIARWAIVPGTLAVIALTPAIGLAQTMPTEKQTEPTTQPFTPPSAPVAQPVAPMAMVAQPVPAAGLQELAHDIPAPSFLRPEIEWIPGLGLAVDTGGPAIRIEQFQPDE